ncbi:DUF6493 family protein [Streptomyces albus]|uniref:DUF6493 family protein n=1 Tax=Streptomyces sp. PHES57 TaxID=2872626 RepID=UPI001CED8D0F|nr:DUF6493 family protein [Streptomyces sp. PHES57]
MVHRLLEVPEACSDFQYSWSGEPGWPAALAGLAGEGRLSREMLIDGCLSRLLAGGRPGVLKGFLALLTALDLTEDERAAHTLTWVRMLPDAHPLVAARAQKILAGLDDAGRLETEHLVEASEAALFRPEKKLVRAQLSMLDKAMKRQRSRTDELLRVAAEAFGHEEHSLQERALALVVRHRKHASGTALAGLAASAGRSAPPRPSPGRRCGTPPHRRALVPTGGFSGYADRPEPFRSLLAAHDPVGSPCRCWGGRRCSPHAFTVLPRHREVVAAGMLLSFGDLAESDELGEGTPVLPALAASGGPAGPAAHLLLAYGLGARRAEEQLFAVDALLALAAGGQLDAARLGQGIAELTGLHRLKLRRIAAALREVVQAGAYATVWAVLSAALPPLLRGTAPHGLSALLSLAAECAQRFGTHEGIPEIDEPAARQLVKQARRIKSATAAGRRSGAG